MFVTLDIQEINEFPEEIKKFLYNPTDKREVTLNDTDFTHNIQTPKSHVVAK